MLRLAEAEPGIVAFWLGGSRGKGRDTQYSDYDCMVVLDDTAPLRLRAELDALRQPGLDLGVMSLAAFETHAAWGSAEAWDRYSFVGLKALVDKTGRMPALFAAKACVPPDAAPAFIDASLDHLLNQLYRGLKCLRDGDPAASRLEAAEGVKPFLDAIFTLHSGRLRPYYRYLAEDLALRPLTRLPFDGRELVTRLEAVLGPDAALALQRLTVDTHQRFREAGHSTVFDAWDEAMDWMLTWRP